MKDRNTIILCASVIFVIAAIAGFALSQTVLSVGETAVISSTMKTISGATQTPRNSTIPVALSEFGICSQNCGYPAPYISGMIGINETSSWQTVQYFVNGTGSDVRTFSGDSVSGPCDYLWKSGSPAPIIRGDYYNLTFILGFADGKNFTLSTFATAD